ncbi:MAG TPA: helix-turn-helix domain-containing protein, partial [Methylomirabilota bacterium]|nr:helix-turn-helix domain-containing protein [Methylomirabilota bacterium]
QHCTEDELMQGAWGQRVERSTFTQRMHHLRKKLKEQCGEEIIENRYGGNYSLKHPDWFHIW